MPSVLSASSVSDTWCAWVIQCTQNQALCEIAFGESFNNHYFWLSVLQSWPFLDKLLYCFSRQKHHSYWSSDARFLSSYVMSCVYVLWLDVLQV